MKRPASRRAGARPSRLAVGLVLLGVGTASAAEVTWRTAPDGGRIVAVTGVIARGDGLKVQRVFDEAARDGERVATLELNSGGGTTDDALLMARLVAAAKATTLVPARGLCSSACFFPWAAGAVRKAGLGACIGLHSTAQAIGRTNVETALAKMRTVDLARLLSGYGTPAAIVGHMVLTKHDVMYWLSAAEIASMAQADEPEPPPSLADPRSAGVDAGSREARAWDAVRTSQDIQLLRKFVWAYPKSFYVKQANGIVYQLEQRQMLTTNKSCEHNLPVWNQPR